MLKQKSIAIVNDISGFGRCSITVSLPILSAMGISCGIVPTAILSNQTEYPDYTMLDFTPYMEEYIQKWKSLQFSFDAIYTGFLGSAKQISIIENFIDQFHFSNRIIDPVMGDHGVIYDSYTLEMCQQMKSLVSRATLVTPNVTELCLLTDTPYCENLTLSDIEKMCQTLAQSGPSNIIVTGITASDTIGNAIYTDETFEVLYNQKILPLRPGTGDVFASIVAGSYLHKQDLRKCVQLASDYIVDCLKTSQKMDVPINDGVCFELHLSKLSAICN